MKNMQKQALNIKNIIIGTAIVVMTALALGVTYGYEFSAPIKVLVWIGWLTLTLVLFFSTDKGRQVFLLGKEAKLELQKVVWPSRQETIQTTSIVMIMVVVAGFILWGVDSGMMWAIAKLTRLG